MVIDTIMMKHVSTGKDSFQGWLTPKPLREQFLREFGLTLDVASDDWNALTRCHYTGTKKGGDGVVFDDALTQTWDCLLDANGFGGAWMNPPYNDTSKWLEKAREEVESGRCCRVVALVPAAVGVAWFDTPLREHEVHVFDKRIRFDLPPPERLPEKYRDGRTRKSPGGGSVLIIIEPDGLVGVTAIRSATTGAIVHDFLDTPVQTRVAA